MTFLEIDIEDEVVYQPYFDSAFGEEEEPDEDSFFSEFHDPFIDDAIFNDPFVEEAEI